ncbi:NADP-dependent glyceraldehyde-3-phosphate dehydrogenase [uncultured Clostridium sp.]|uniref:NADP-dependent glyceraldehyde-3-phosphate dehydrogenase n=1 Tax=uncultured Clostridium sp. TaxID=59620 RepID=UPI0025EEBFE0|nr:NADP-dependent glyceraldehyde-3-phosphate dehydrogenase [uncultured Clostridium sp.]
MFDKIKGENNTFKNLVDGEWISSSSGNFIDINSPVDNSLVGRVPAMTVEEVDVSMESASKVQKEWKSIPLNAKADILYKAADLLIENIDELSHVMMMEIAKDMKSCRSEVTRSADFIKFTADCAKNLYGESIPSDSFPGTKKNKISIVKREPLGVVLAISPFNYPINLAASKIAPAVIIGNSVVLKPATQGSISGLHLARIFEMAGLPKGVLNTVTGRGSEIGDYITSHKYVDFINFTGSTEVGERISKHSLMVPLLMELGGKDAAIVLEDSDLDLVADNIASGAYSYSGQRCTAVKRVLAVDKIADELVEKVKMRIEKFKIGNLLENESVDIVPLISEKSADYVSQLIADAEIKGADLVIGGKREGNLIYPTLFDKVTTDMRIAWEEPFGPVVPIIRVKDMDEAVEIANASEYGLQGSIFTKNIYDAFNIADKLEVGTVQINGKTERGPDNFPFLGTKSSGMGTQGIKYSIESMSRPKLTVVNL